MKKLRFIDEAYISLIMVLAFIGTTGFNIIPYLIALCIIFFILKFYQKKYSSRN
jgi:phage shock protein PspC (stress-responsive transcriptional regulator)